MNDTAQKIVELTRMFDAYGQTPTPSRLEMYLETIGPCSPSQLAEGTRHAMREATDYPPGPGTVARCVRAIARNRAGDPIESHQDPYHRSGQIAAPAATGALMDGFARRTPGMQAIFKRAREIRAAGLVPADLWGRFASEVMAELEIDPHAEVSPEMRRCMAHARAWREEYGREWEAA